MKTKKSTDILSGQNLLIVKSIHSHKAELSKFKYLITVTIVYVVFIICLFAFTQRINFEIVSISALLTVAGGAFAYLLLNEIRRSGNPLIFTPKGIAIPNRTCNYWNEIESFCWEEYKGKKKVPGPFMFTRSEGTSLRITPKSGLLASKWTNSFGGNVLAYSLIFFTPE
jgi:hypothetical protein